MMIGETAEKYLRAGHSFASITQWYTCTEQQTRSAEVTFKKTYTLYIAHPFEGADPVILYDATGIVMPGVNVYTVEPATMALVDHVWGTSPTPSVKVAVEKLIRSWGLDVTDANVRKVLLTRMFVPCPRLRDASFLRGEDGRRLWAALLDSLLSFGNAAKDSRLRQVFKCHLLRGRAQRYNPHAIVCTNPSTGKSAFYERTGVRLDKCTANSLIGYARGAKEVYYGSIHNLSHTLTIEQIESQIALTLLSFLLSFMESGASKLSVGGVEMLVKGTCPVVLTANPTGYEADKISTFKAFLDHLTTNPLALGRRFGLVVYGNYEEVDRTAHIDEEEWSRHFELFRAVEETAQAQIQEVYSDSGVTKWLNTPIRGYAEAVLKVTEKVYDASVKDFIKTHAQGAFRHIRGGALACAIVDSVPNLLEDGALIVIPLILIRAEECLAKLTGINIESFANMVGMVETDEQVRKYLAESLPVYLKEISEAVQAFRNKEGDNAPKEVPLQALDTYLPKHTYKRASEIEDTILKTSKRWRFYNGQLEKYFKYRIGEEKEGFVVFLR